MVSIDCLAALDYLLWLRTGRRAADHLGVSQPTISRNTRHCTELFNIRVVKKGGEWEVLGNHALLDAERRVHQRYRWDHHAPLRLDGHDWMADNLQGFQPSGWIKGNVDYRDHTRPLALIKGGIIDAWLCSDPDRPEDPGLTAWQLSRSRIDLVVRHGHPLLELGDHLSLDNLGHYPLMPLPEGAPAALEQGLRSAGLASSWDRAATIGPSPRPGQVATEDLTMAIASPLTGPLQASDMVRLPISLPLEQADLLVVRSEFAHHPRTASLIEQLLAHLRTVAAGLEGITVFDQALLCTPGATPAATAAAGAR